MSEENNMNGQEGMGFGKSMAVVFGVTALMVGIVLALKYLIG